MIEGCYLEELQPLEPAGRRGLVRRPAPALEGPGLRLGRRPGRAGLPAPRPEVPRLRALDRLLPGHRQGVDGRPPRDRVRLLGRPDRPRHAPLRPRPPRPRGSPPSPPSGARTSRTPSAPSAPPGTSSDGLLLDLRPRDLLLLPRLRRRPPEGRRRDRGGPGGALLAQEARLRLPHRAIQYVLHEAGDPARASSTRSASTTSRSSSSSGCSRPTWPPSRGPSTPSGRRCRSGSTRSSGCPRSSARSSSPTRGRSSSPSTT